MLVAVIQIQISYKLVFREITFDSHEYWQLKYRTSQYVHQRSKRQHLTGYILLLAMFRHIANYTDIKRRSTCLKNKKKICI